MKNQALIFISVRHPSWLNQASKAEIIQNKTYLKGRVMAEGFIAVHKLKNALWRCAVCVGAVCVGVVCVGVQRAQFKRRFLLIAAISLTLVGLSACAPIVPKASPLNIDYTRIPDPAEPPTEAEMDALEAQAKNGDWNLKVFFAEAYFEEKLDSSSPRNWMRRPCAKRFTYGHVCRAAAERTEAAEGFLREVLDHPDQRFWQLRGRFGQKRVKDAYPNSPYTYPNIPDHSDDPACKEGVHYLERAVQEETAPTSTSTRSGSSCIFARDLAYMASFGKCVPEDKQRTLYWFEKTDGCPVP